MGGTGGKQLFYTVGSINRTTYFRVGPLCFAPQTRSGDCDEGWRMLLPVSGRITLITLELRENLRLSDSIITLLVNDAPTSATTVIPVGSTTDVHLNTDIVINAGDYITLLVEGTEVPTPTPDPPPYPPPPEPWYGDRLNFDASLLFLFD